MQAPDPSSPSVPTIKSSLSLSGGSGHLLRQGQQKKEGRKERKRARGEERKRERERKGGREEGRKEGRQTDRQEEKELVVQGG